jgi:hypothetical protein
MIAFVLRTGKGATAYLPQDSQFQTGYLLWCVMLTLFEMVCKSFLRFVSNLSTAEKEKAEEPEEPPPLYPPLAQILPRNRFPVNPWFTMNHGVHADLYVRYRQSTEAAYYIFINTLVIRLPNA